VSFFCTKGVLHSGIGNYLTHVLTYTRNMCNQRTLPANQWTHGRFTAEYRNI